MGILDDAIREHLELKRAHGASEAEVTLKEEEAFGPVRHEVAAEAPAAETVADAPPADETALLQPADLEGDAPAEPEPEPPTDHGPLEELAPDPADHPVPDPHDHAGAEGKDPAWGADTEIFAEPPAPPVQHHEDHRPPVFDTDEHLHAGSRPPDPVFGHQAEAPRPAPVEDPPVIDPPVVDPPVEEPPVHAPGEPSDEDVLEETPEFLQDAPEHDRLWFEQKPPRDFDFGE
jgi:hypothetical protein